jgi:hypothetical protein
MYLFVSLVLLSLMLINEDNPKNFFNCFANFALVNQKYISKSFPHAEVF